MKKKLVFAILSMIAIRGLAQRSVYEVDLTKVIDDKVQVRLTVPQLKKNVAVFHFPKIIPGTYRISDYGKFIHDMKAFDRSGKPMAVKRLNDNSWQIANAGKLASIEYMVEDTWDTDIANDIYSMSGTNIEEGKNFVVNTPGFFGFIEELRSSTFELRFKRPADLYAATALIPLRSSSIEDVFEVRDADHMYDSPIMFSAPDTTTIRLGSTEVLIAVYSPKKQVMSQFIAQLLGNVLSASSKYLGGRLPVNKYAFIFYFNGEQRPFTVPGALEHNNSSFYSLPEAPQQALAPTIMDIAAHEFFHIITPLTIRSKEVKNFNFSEPVLSRHLWLYEGSTEYASDHVQVKYGLNTINQFLDKLSTKIKNSKKQYQDSLAFTELSKESAGVHREQYGNVYEKGALISACLDILLLHHSNGAYDLADLKHDLSVRFGQREAFDDEKLFEVIAEITYPEIRDFFRKYVEGNEPLPYEQIFALAGIQYTPLVVRSEISLGNVSFGATQNSKIMIIDDSKINAFGKKIGFKRLDEVLSINGVSLTPSNAASAIGSIINGLKEGSMVTVKVVRGNGNGGKDTLELSAPAEKAEVKEEHKLRPMDKVSERQATVRRTWLAADNKGIPLTNNKADVAEIDNIIKALYDVISGPAGPRDWDRFRALFTPTAIMGAAVGAQGGAKYVTFTPEEYSKKNGSVFLQDSFMEKELGRTLHQFGNIAQVFTSYEFDLGNGKVKQRGINSVQLVKEQGRWWIASVIWQEESKDLPIPTQYLK